MRKYFFIFLLIFAVGAILFWIYLEIFKSPVTTINNSADEVKVGMNLELTGLSD